MLANSAYLSGFRYAMDFVWAKCIFSTVLALRLCMLLEEELNEQRQIVQKPRQVLKQLESVSKGHRAYVQILNRSIHRYEYELRTKSFEHTPSPVSREGVDLSEADADGWAPNELLSEWNFSALNFRHVPIWWPEVFSL